MLASKIVKAGVQVTRSRTAFAVVAATLLVGGSVTEASAKSRHHHHHHFASHHRHHHHADVASASNDATAWGSFSGHVVVLAVVLAQRQCGGHGVVRNWPELLRRRVILRQRIRQQDRVGTALQPERHDLCAPLAAVRHQVEGQRRRTQCHCHRQRPRAVRPWPRARSLQGRRARTRHGRSRPRHCRSRLISPRRKCKRHLPKPHAAKHCVQNGRQGLPRAKTARRHLPAAGSFAFTVVIPGLFAQSFRGARQASPESRGYCKERRPKSRGSGFDAIASPRNDWKPHKKLCGSTSTSSLRLPDVFGPAASHCRR